ncbi:MAG TPA: ABC transporter permease [Ktedonobacteraceae bacterium]|jgi:peptide/nickel transport system permease protein|nr:ABC transporter permease [Ktedonobacteraceae bacterium]
MKVQQGAQTLSSAGVLVPSRPPGYTRILHALRAFWHVLTLNRKVATGSAIVGFFIVVGLIGPFFMTIDPEATSHLFLTPPAPAHLLGTTVVGEDIFSQLVYGTRTSVFWGLGTGILVTVLSVLVGLVGGYFGGVVDDLLTLLTNISLVLPALPLAIVLAAYFPRGPLTISLVIVCTNWAWQARVLRSQTLSMRSREFVTAARLSGENVWRIIFFEIFPNEIGLVVAGFVSTTIYVVLTWASLEFLGLGDGTIPSWGGILYWAQQAGALGGGLWWWFVPPGACIAVLGAGLSLINFGIDEIADPRLHVERPTKVKKAKKKSAHGNTNKDAVRG